MEFCSAPRTYIVIYWKHIQFLFEKKKKKKKCADIPELDMLNAAQSGGIAFRLHDELTYLIERK